MAIYLIAYETLYSAFIGAGDLESNTELLSFRFVSHSSSRSHIALPNQQQQHQHLSTHSTHSTQMASSELKGSSSSGAEADPIGSRFGLPIASAPVAQLRPLPWMLLCALACVRAREQLPMSRPATPK